jgi:PadR family transcriptional regulator, regulatory protein PadR
MLGEFEQLLLLAILRIGDDAYGVPIRDVLRDRAGRRVTLGAVYTTLGRLSEKGLVKSHTGAPTADRGGRRTRCYTLTDAARRELRQSLRAIDRLSAGLDLGVGGAR